MAPYASAVLLALACMAAPLPDDPGVCRWKLEKGRTFYQEVTAEIRVEMKIMGQEVVDKQNHTIHYSWTPVRQEGTGWVMRQKIEAMKMERADGVNGPLTDFCKAVTGAEFTVTFDRDLRVVKIDGREGLVKKLIAANPQMETLIEATLSEAAMKESTEASFSALPPRPLEKGESWLRTCKLDMGPAGRYRMNYEYVQDGKEGRFVRFKVNGIDFKYEPPANNAPNQPFVIKRANLEGKKGSGTILFDPEKGRVERSEISLEIQGDMTISIGEQDTTVELRQQQKTVIRMLDENPIKK